MLFSELFEAPISDFQTLGDWTKNSSYVQQDRKLLTNPKAVKKIELQWEKTPVDFNLFFVNSPEARRHSEVGEVDRDWLDENLPNASGQIPWSPDKVTIIFTNNSGSERVPMTGWVIAHRFGHVVARFAGGGKRQVPEFTDAREELLGYTSRFLENYGIIVPGSEGSRGYNPGIAAKNRAMTNFYQAIGTMKSARDKNIRNEFEFLLELLAQYMLTGKVKFNNLPKAFKVGNSTYQFQGNDHDYEYFNGGLEDLAETLGYMFDNLMSACVGSTFVM